MKSRLMWSFVGKGIYGKCAFGSHIFVQKIKTKNGTFLSTEENECGGIIQADDS